MTEEQLEQIHILIESKIRLAKLDVTGSRGIEATKEYGDLLNSAASSADKLKELCSDR
jgi:hypothetical protein